MTEKLQKDLGLIWEFMGKWEYVRRAHYPDLMEVESELLDGNDIHYHDSYNWLIPVWQKFRDLKFEDHHNAVIHRTYMDDIANYMMYQPIDVAFAEIVEAITWYTSLNKSETK